MQLQHLSTCKCLIQAGASIRSENQSNDIQNAYIWIYPKVEQVVIQGKDNITEYAMGQKMMLKSFCKTCGVQLSNRSAPLSEEEIAALSPESKVWFDRGQQFAPVNLRTINGLDLSALNVKKGDGFNLILPKYVNP